MTDLTDEQLLKDIHEKDDAMEQLCGIINALRARVAQLEAALREIGGCAVGQPEVAKWMARRALAALAQPAESGATCKWPDCECDQGHNGDMTDCHVQREQSAAKSDEEAARETRAVDHTGDYIMSLEDVARSLAQARAEGRAAGMEEAAKIVESYGNSAHNTTNTVRAISAAIRGAQL